MMSFYFQNDKASEIKNKKYLGINGKQINNTSNLFNNFLLE